MFPRLIYAAACQLPAFSWRNSIHDADRAPSVSPPAVVGLRVVPTFWLLGTVPPGTLVHICFNASFRFSRVPYIQTYPGADLLGHMVVLFGEADWDFNVLI